jgi:molybdate transport system substrate-binding protein
MLVRTTVSIAVATLIAALALPPQAARAQDARVTVFAAASLKNALDDANAAYTQATALKVIVSYAATPALVRQIEAGAPADVFVSADVRWMDYAVEKRLVAAHTRVNLLGNKLVLIAPKASKLDKVAIAHGFNIAELAGDGRIAVANVASVPAGRYAKAALEWLDAWATAENKLAQTENVRAALAFVARGETPLGIVYETDAKAEPRVKVIGIFPGSSHPPVTYPVAAVTTAKPGAARYLDFLRSSAAKSILEAHGFSYLIRPTS